MEAEAGSQEKVRSSCERYLLPMGKTSWTDRRLSKALVLGIVALSVFSTTTLSAPTMALSPAFAATATSTDGQRLITADAVEEPLVSTEVDSALDSVWVAEQKRLKIEAEAKAKRAAEAKREEAQRKLEEREAAEVALTAPLGVDSSPEAPAYTGGGSKDQWLTEAGIAKEDWPYVDFIVSKESGWNPNAVNSSSGASGLVQALPCGKVPGSCFDPVDNLKWASGYASDRYGGWKGAFDFWSANHWW